jgi:cold shock CspA family protein
VSSGDADSPAWAWSRRAAGAACCGAESSTGSISYPSRKLCKDPFVHQSEIDREGFRSLDEGMKVTYEEEPGDKGPKAVRVKLV